MATVAKSLKHKVYCYCRFSTPEQANGDSERRQLELARKFAADKKFELEIICDRGYSGYTAEHITEGKFGVFLEKVKAGAIAPESILVAENVDRLSRQEFSEAYPTMALIVSKGITIEILEPRLTIDKTTINDHNLIYLVVQQQLANGESKKKSVRGKESWGQKRKRANEGEVPTRIIPAWIKVPEDRTQKIKKADLSLFEDARTTIKKIFEWRKNGISNREIVTRLNAGVVNDVYWAPAPVLRTPKGSDKKVEQPADGTKGEWIHSYLGKVLTSRAVLGEYQPHKMVDGKRIPDGPPIKNFFPRLIDDQTFEYVQAKRRENAKIAGGRTGKFSNCLRYLTKCAYCGQVATFVDKGPTSKGGKYIKCELSQRSVKHWHNDRKTIPDDSLCGAKPMRYEEILCLILDNCPKLDPGMIVQISSEANSQIESIIQTLGAVKAEREQRIVESKNLRMVIRETNNARTRKLYDEDLVRCLDRIDELEKQEVELSKKHFEVSKSAEYAKDWQKGILTLREKLNGDDPSPRMILNNHLRELIDRVEIFSTGYALAAQDWDEVPEHKMEVVSAGKRQRIKIRRDPPKVDDIELRLFDILTDAGLTRKDGMFDFVNEMSVRRRSREGRFIRVFFKSGKWIDLAPHDSLADHATFHPGKHENAKGRFNGWDFHSPNVGIEFESFVKQQKRLQKQNG